jgi:hypothetical protein
MCQCVQSPGHEAGRHQSVKVAKYMRDICLFLKMARQHLVLQVHRVNAYLFSSYPSSDGVLLMGGRLSNSFSANEKKSQSIPRTNEDTPSMQ